VCELGAYTEDGGPKWWWKDEPRASQVEALPCYIVPSVRLLRDVYHHHGFFQAWHESLDTLSVPSRSCRHYHSPFCSCP